MSVENSEYELAPLVERVRQDVREAFASDVIDTALALRQDRPGEFQVFRSLLKGADVLMREWDRALSQRTPRGQVAKAQVPARHPADFLLTDTGNAEALIERHGDDLRYNATSQRWLVWDGRRWADDIEGKVHQLAKDTLRAMRGTADDDHLDTSESRRGREAMVALAKHEPGVTITFEQLDTDPMVFNCANGTIDLRTGERRDHRREDLISKLSPVEYDPAATCPLFEKFLAEAQPDGDVRAMLQRLDGYSLTGTIKEQVLPIFYGGGGNGKGVYQNIRMHVWGDYARTVPTELLMESKGDQHPTGKTVLLGTRLACASETEEGRSLNVALVKALTGGDRIPARYMHKDFFEFDPTHKLSFATNHKPTILETKNAIWRRVVLVPWAVSFVGREDLELEKTLRGEAAGILAWAVRGCLAWQKGGLAPPEAVKTATKTFRDEMDRIADWIDEQCQVSPSAREKAADLFRSYTSWCERVGDKPMTQRAFGERMTERGFDRQKSHGVKVYIGIRALNHGEIAARNTAAMEETAPNGANGSEDHGDHGDNGDRETDF